MSKWINEAVKDIPFYVFFSFPNTYEREQYIGGTLLMLTDWPKYLVYGLFFGPLSFHMNSRISLLISSKEFKVLLLL